jgi:hypothetical protein
LLWTYPVDGINDVWPADLDGDGDHEVIIGYNGFTGVHVLDSSGKKLWESQHIGNVWRVGAVDLDGDGAAEVVTSADAKGKIAAFKGDGTRLPDIAVPAGYHCMLRPLKLSGHDDAQGLLLMAESGDAIAAMDAAGKLAWELSLGKRAALNTVEVAEGKPWVALFLVDAAIECATIVVDTSTGRRIAEMTDPYKGNRIGWMPAKDGAAPLLLRITDSGVSAFRLTS